MRISFENLPIEFIIEKNLSFNLLHKLEVKYISVISFDLEQTFHAVDSVLHDLLRSDEGSVV